MDQDLLRRYHAFRELYARQVGTFVPARIALENARTEQRAEREGLSVTWTDDDLPCVHRRADTLASLGGIGLDSWSDPYVRDVEAELLGEALAELDAERERDWTHSG